VGAGVGFEWLRSTLDHVGDGFFLGLTPWHYGRLFTARITVTKLNHQLDITVAIDTDSRC